MSGVPLTDLCCPTCGEHFVLPLSLHSDAPEEYDFQTFTEIHHRVDWYIICPNRHKWTIQTVWRTQGRVDEVQLDRYLGTA
jgi:hypothetical protein